MLLDELKAYLVAQGVGVFGTSLFLGSKARIPSENGDDGPYISLIETGGSGPTRIQNQSTANTQRPTVQVVVRAKSYLVARTKSKQVYQALDGLYNTTLSGVLYHSVVARQEPTDIGLDTVDRPMVVFNLDIEKAFS
jgi:hypothetical protein